MNYISKWAVKSLLVVVVAVLCFLSPFLVANAATTDSDTYTYVTCYFKKPGDRTWQWGLDSKKNWYKLNGRWEKQPDTGVMRFITNKSRNEIAGSCINSQSYYNRDAYSIDGIYAADSSLGYNYPIYAQGQEVTP